MPESDKRLRNTVVSPDVNQSVTKFSTNTTTASSVLPPAEIDDNTIISEVIIDESMSEQENRRNILHKIKDWESITKMESIVLYYPKIERTYVALKWKKSSHANV